MNMVNTTYNSSEDTINKSQSLKGKTKLKFFKNISTYYDEMNIGNFKFEQDPFSKNAQGFNKIYHEIFLLMNFLKTKPQVKNMNINYYDLYNTVTKDRDENKVVVDKFENNENDYINFNQMVPNHYIGRTNDNRKIR